MSFRSIRRSEVYKLPSVDPEPTPSNYDNLVLYISYALAACLILGYLGFQFKRLVIKSSELGGLYNEQASKCRLRSRSRSHSDERPRRPSSRSPSRERRPASRRRRRPRCHCDCESSEISTTLYS